MRATSGGMTAPALLRRIITVLLLCAAPGVALAIGDDRAPTANAGPDRTGLAALTGRVGTTITLDGSASKERQDVADGTNANLLFAWTQLDDGAPAVILTGTGAEIGDSLRFTHPARVGYGVALRTREGMLTPYGELTLGATNSYRLGMIWKTGTRFGLTLLGERRENTGDPTEHSLLLRRNTPSCSKEKCGFKHLTSLRARADLAQACFTTCR